MNIERNTYNFTLEIHGDAVVVMCKVEDKERVAQELSKVMHDAAVGTHDMKVGAPEYTFNNHPQDYAHYLDEMYQIELVNSRFALSTASEKNVKMADVMRASLAMLLEEHGDH